MIIKLKDFYHQYSNDQSILRFEQNRQISSSHDCVLMTNQGQILSILQLVYHHDPERINYYGAHYLSTNFMKEIMEFSDNLFLNVDNSVIKPPVFLDSLSVVDNMDYNAGTDYSPIGFLAFTNLHDHYALVDHALSEHGVMLIEELNSDINELIFQRVSLAVKPLIFSLKASQSLSQYQNINFNGLTLSIVPYHTAKTQEVANTTAMRHYLKYSLCNSFTMNDVSYFSKLINYAIAYSDYPNVVSKYFSDKFSQFLQSKLMFQPNVMHSRQKIVAPNYQQALNVDQLLALQDCEVV